MSKPINRNTLRSKVDDAAFHRLTTKSKIIWLHEHRVAIAEEVFRLRLKNPCTHILKLVQQSIKILPQELQRTVNQLAQVPWLNPMLIELFEQYSERFNAATEAAKSSAETIQQLSRENEELRHRLKCPDVSSMSLNDIFGLASSKIESLVDAKMALINQTSVETTKTTEHSKVVHTTVSTVPPRRKILLVGFSEGQVSVIRTALQDVPRLDLRHLIVDDQNFAGNRVLPSCEYAFVNVSRAGNAIAQRVKQSYGKLTRYHSGGTDSVIPAIREALGV